MTDELHTLTCPRCGHTDSSASPAEEIISVCGDCGLRVAFGTPMPRVVVEPAGRLIRARIEPADKDAPPVELLVDPMYATAIAQNLLSIVRLPL